MRRYRCLVRAPVSCDCATVVRGLGLPANHVQLGVTRVFLKNGACGLRAARWYAIVVSVIVSVCALCVSAEAYVALESRRAAVWRASVLLVQSVYRGYRCRSHYQLMRRSAVIIQVRSISLMSLPCTPLIQYLSLLCSIPRTHAHAPCPTVKSCVVVAPLPYPADCCRLRRSVLCGAGGRGGPFYTFECHVPRRNSNEQHEASRRARASNACARRCSGCRRVTAAARVARSPWNCTARAARCVCSRGYEASPLGEHSTRRDGARLLSSAWCVAALDAVWWLCVCAAPWCMSLCFYGFSCWSVTRSHRRLTLALM